MTPRSETRRSEPAPSTADDAVFLRCMEQVVRLLAQEHLPSRVEFLRIACNLLNQPNCAAVLWIWDTEWNRLMINRCYYVIAGAGLPIEEKPLHEPPKELLRRQAQHIGPEIASAFVEEPEHWKLSLQHQPEIRAWCQKHGFAEDEKSFPVATTPKGSDESQGFGFVQLFSAAPIPEAVSRTMPIVCFGLAGEIVRSRTERQLSALDAMLKKSDLATIEQWLGLAAKTLQKVNLAELCVVFHRERHVGWRAVSGWPPNPTFSSLIADGTDSVVARVAKKCQPARLRDFSDPEERSRILGTKVFDTTLYKMVRDEILKKETQSFLAAPVMVAGLAFAVIVLVNKSTKHLAGVFSRNDVDVLQQVCGFLAGVIPSVESYGAIGRISETTIRGFLHDENLRHALFDILADLIPGLAYVSLVRSRAGQKIPEMIAISENSWFPNAPIPTAQTTTLAPVMITLGADSRPVQLDNCKQYVLEIPQLDRETSFLAVGLQRKDNIISGYETSVLQFLGKELSTIIREEQAIEDLVQIRHAVRAGLHGTVGYLQEAMGCYEIYSTRNDTSFLTGARFRKALQRSALFGKQVQVLIEEARFLLGQITNDRLKVSEFSISKLVHGVVTCLRPSAEQRKFKIEFQNIVPDSFDLVCVDEQLIELLVFNLIDNAIKYSSSRAQNVTVELSANPVTWRVEVTNLGAHIPKNVRKEIFEPFVRASTAERDAASPGTGLGLAVALAVAKAHNGRITVESRMIQELPRPQAETTFVVTIPRLVKVERIE